ncbi:MAG: ATP-binding cassette domain-containing protein, partial [Microbacteriaceae bacterium]
GTALPSATVKELASLMVGREVLLEVDKAPAQLGQTTFVIENLTAKDERGHLSLDNINLEISEGEVVVIAGVQGNGQTELTEAIVGLIKAEGSIQLKGAELIGQSVKQVLDSGVGFVPEDRTVDGLIKEFTVAENMILDRSDRAPFASGINLKPKVISAFADEKIAEFDVRTQSQNTSVGDLSGGNQQKVVLARELSRPLNLFIASQPTRGLDVGSIEFVHKQIIKTRDAGVPVLIVSTELDEVYALADRIAVMYHGKIIGIVTPDATREKIGSLMAGVAE